MATVMALVCVADRQRALAFYADTLGPVFGLPAPAGDAFGDEFRGAGGVIRLTAIPGWQPGPHPVLGWRVADAAAAARALAAAGVVLLRYPGFDQDELGLWTSPDGTARVAWFHDSEGNLLSFTQA